MMAMPVITVVGGACWVPMAWRVMDSTTAILTKLVTIMPTKGTRAKPAMAVIRISGRLLMESLPRMSTPPSTAPSSLLGLPRAAWATDGATPTTKRMNADQPARRPHAINARSGRDRRGCDHAAHRCLHVLVMRSPRCCAWWVVAGASTMTVPPGSIGS